MLVHLFLVPILVVAWSTVAVGSEGTPGEQLARMSDALRSLSYEGTLVYLHENKLETLRIVHRVEDGQVHEQLVSLNGPVRTLTREKGKVTCELSDSHPISVPGHAVGKDVLYARTIDPGALADNYLVHPLGTARVAGRQTDVVGIIPRDGLRYGYRFYLDRVSGLPLKSDLMGQQTDPIEQIMFTSLDLLPSGDLVSTVAKPVQEPPPPGAVSVVPDSSPWQFAALPPGFTLVMRDNWRDAAGEPVEHFVLSDGLASVSVYVESDPEEGLEGGTRIGAVHAAGSRVSDHQVTVVGEVPSATVDAVLAGIRRSEGDPP
jgi:sigma-E factor negative regulatory protein RseB